MKKNKELNLSAIRDVEGIRVKHILDSLHLVESGIIKPGMRVVDIGTGGGFPLIPLAMHFPDVNFTGIDSIKKKTIAVNQMIEELEIKNAKVIRTRIEEYKGDLFDIVTARAVAYVDKLIEWAYPLLKKGGYFLLMKKEDGEEKKILINMCSKYKLLIQKEIRYKLYEGDITRIIYVVKKI